MELEKSTPCNCSINETVTVQNRSLSGCIPAIASKSHAHRLLICAALADKPTKIRCTTTNADIEATCSCLRSLGAGVEREGEFLTVAPIAIDKLLRNQTLDCGESGSTMRFILPVVLALGADASLYGHGRLPSRPLSPLYGELAAHGAEMSPEGSNPLICRGSISPGEYSIDGSVSSQFISGLMFALPVIGVKTGKPSRIVITGKAESRPYIDLTVSALRQFGIDIAEPEKNTFVIGTKPYVSPGEVCTEGDWSNAAFWLSAGAFSEQGISMTMLNPDSIQGDKRILDILSAFGADVNVSKESAADTASASELVSRITVKRGVKPLHGIEIDAADIPDLVPVISVAASGALGKTVISGCGRLKLKESDRIKSVCDMITSLGGDISSTDDTITVIGHGSLSGGEVDSANDHRIVMSAAVASVICSAPVVINGAAAAAKSYPAFFEDMKKL